MILIGDIEANGLLDEWEDQVADRIHVISFKSVGDITIHGSITGSQDEIKQHWIDLLNAWDDLTVVFHNGIAYDLPLIEKLFGIPFTVEPDTINGKKVQIIDTLVLSRNWFPDINGGHSLESWAKRLGTFKPEIDDWENLPLEVYVDRCENDVITTEKVFLKLAEKLGVEI